MLHGTFYNWPNILYFKPKFFRENIHLFREKKKNGKESTLNSHYVSEFLNWVWSFQTWCLNRHSFRFLWNLELGKGSCLRAACLVSVATKEAQADWFSFICVVFHSLLQDDLEEKHWSALLPSAPNPFQVCLLSKVPECWARKACDTSNTFEEKSRLCLTEHSIT